MLFSIYNVSYLTAVSYIIISAKEVGVCSVM